MKKMGTREERIKKIRKIFLDLFPATDFIYDIRSPDQTAKHRFIPSGVQTPLPDCEACSKYHLY
jgi:hypothetical protein